jgi:hypothetical protein
VVQLFHKSFGYSVGIKIVGNPRLGSTSAPPPPPPRGPDDDLDNDDEDSGWESLSEGEWRALGKKDAERKARSAQAALEPADKAGGEAAKEVVLDEQDIPDSPFDRRRSAPASIDLGGLDQYGSNLGRGGKWPAPLVEVELLRAMASPTL